MGAFSKQVLNWTGTAEARLAIVSIVDSVEY